MAGTRTAQRRMGWLMAIMTTIGIGAAVAPLRAQPQMMLCMTVVQSCNSNECLDFCNTYYPTWDTVVCTQGNCCNCYL